MDSKKILPYKIPLSTMYHYNAFSLGIVQAKYNDDEFLNFLLNNYLNCSFWEESPGNKFNIGYDLWLEKQNIITRYSFKLSRQIYNVSKVDILSVLKNAIQKGIYPQGNYNERWVPGKKAYNKYYFYHDYLLIGYNDDLRKFISVGFLENKKFDFFEIPYDNMIIAIETLGGNINIDFLEFNECYKPKFDLTLFKKEIKDYLLSEGDKFENKVGQKYGVSAVLELYNHIYKQAYSNHSIDLRYVKGLEEFKQFMYLRMKFLYEKNYLKNETFVKFAETVWKEAQKIYLLSLKYSVTQELKNIEKIEKLFIDIIKLENEYLSKLIDEL